MHKVLELAQLWQVDPQGQPLISSDGALLFGMKNEKPVAIKQLGRSFDAKGAGLTAQAFSGICAVEVIASTEEALLLERAIPGTSLREAMSENSEIDDTAIFCDIALKLHQTAARTDTVPHTEYWYTTLEKPSSNLLDELGSKTIARAQDIRVTLAENYPDTCLLHGDLHHDNIIFDQQKGWLAIDPKGVLGDPALEAAAFLRNPLEQADRNTMPDILFQRIENISARTGWSQHRIIGWAYCQSVLSAAWDIEAKIDPTASRLLYQALEQAV